MCYQLSQCWLLSIPVCFLMKMFDMLYSITLIFLLNIFQDGIQPFGHEMFSWVRLRGINARSVSLPAHALASWYQFYCLVNRDTSALVACPELLVRKLVDSGIEPATLRSTSRNLNHTTNCPHSWHLWHHWKHIATTAHRLQIIPGRIVQ